MPLTKEERYRRHREYQSTPEARAKRKVYDAKRNADPEIRLRKKQYRQRPDVKAKLLLNGKKYRQTEKHKEWKKAYRNSDRAKISRRDQLLRKNFAISFEEYSRMLDEQGGVCAVCKTTKQPNEKERMLAVDHSHMTGKIRGLLCRRCNVVLGLANDDDSVLHGLIDYLKKYV